MVYLVLGLVTIVSITLPIIIRQYDVEEKGRK